MQLPPSGNILRKSILPLAALLISPVVSEAIEPRFELNPAQLDSKAAKPSVRHKREREKKEGIPTCYTIKPGDHLYRVVAREYGITDDRADALVAKIRKINHLSDIRRLKVGSTLVIPPIEGGAPPRAHRETAATHPRQTSEQPEPQPEPSPWSPASGYKVVQPGRNLDMEGVEAARQVWSQLVSAVAPATEEKITSSNFSLSLDPDRYPALPAQDGGSILLDVSRTLPPLVKSLIQTKNPQLRVVSESPANRKRFFKSLLDAAHFYSFEEDFGVDFGTDPKVTVTSDFKIEKNADSLLRQDITLLNVAQNRRITPEALRKILAGSGFKLVEAIPASNERQESTPRILYQINENEPKKMVDSMLDALSVPFDTGREIDLFAKEHLGVSLEVHADRYFEESGERFVVAQFNGDPVNYTLVRLLETKGYRVIMLQPGDNFGKVADKLLAGMRFPGRYSGHDLWPLRETGYGVHMSGVMIRSGKTGKEIFLTDRKLDPLVMELVDLNGYRVLSGK